MSTSATGRRSADDALRQQATIEAQAAARTLLARPLIVAGQPGFALIRRHRQRLIRDFRDLAGYELVVDERCARLFKRDSRPRSDRPARIKPAGKHPGHPEDWRAFDRRHYVLLALLLAALERVDATRQVISLRDLADEVRRQAARAELTVPLDTKPDRGRLVTVLGLLTELGVVETLDGNAQTWIAGETGDNDLAAHGVLLRLHSPALRLLRPAGRPLIDARSIDELLDGQAFESPDAAALSRRHNVIRRLLDDPVLYFDELSLGERDAVRAQGDWHAERAARLCGLESERRREGIALITEQNDRSSDRLFPRDTREGKLALMVADDLVRAAQDGPRLGRAQVERVVADIANAHSEYFADAAADAARATAETLELLQAMGLVRVDGMSVDVRPAAGRYRPHLVSDPAATERTQTLSLLDPRQPETLGEETP